MIASVLDGLMPYSGMLPPALWLLVGGLLVACTRGVLRDAVVLLAPVGAVWAVWQVPDGVAATAEMLGYAIEPVEGSATRRLFGTTFCVMAWVGGLFAFRQAKATELAAAFAYASGAVGVSFAGDLMSMFLWWEVMAVFSTFVIWSGGAGARAAGVRYAVIHLLGGVVLKAGIEGIAVHQGTLELAPMRVVDFDTGLVFAGVLLNAAAPPVSAWLSDAYPRASATGSVFLSAFTTKTAVLALILLFPGEQMLVWIGLVMVFYGILMALLENDARRILAYSIVNQVGFMVVAVGIGTELAINGACAHAVAHIFYKALLFMSAGVVLYRTGVTRCTELGGLFRTMPLTAGCAIVGALAISSFPLTSGFTTKTMISAAALESGWDVTYMLLAAASAGVFLHAGIKFPWFVFFQRDSGLRPKDAPWNMAAAMLVLVALAIWIGIAPGSLYALLPHASDFEAYKPAKLVHYLQLLLFAGLAFFVLLPLMKRTNTVTLDTDWLWRTALPRTWTQTANTCSRTYTTAARTLAKLRDTTLTWLTKRVGTESLLAQSWSVSTTALWVVVLLLGYVIVYYA